MNKVEVLLYVVVPLCSCIASLCISCCICSCIFRRIDSRRETQERNAVEHAVRLSLEAADRAAAAASPIVVKKKLGHFPYSAEPGRGAPGEMQHECAICLAEFVDGASCSEVPACRHLFHHDCIEMARTRSSTCPLCRAPIEPLSAAQDMV